MNLKIQTLLISSVIGCAIILPFNALKADGHKLKQVISAEHRAKSSKRDQFRHPVDTLNFFQIKENHTVVEIMPGGGGWYTEILAPLLRDKGQLRAAQYSADSKSSYEQRTIKKFNTKLANNPELYDKVAVVVFSPADNIDLGGVASADRVVTFRNLHNWMKLGDAGVKTIFKSFYDVLKTGGKLGVIDHRLPESRDTSKNMDSGYVKQSYAIQIAESVGFTLEASSELNANAKDDAAHPGGVWTLPPSYGKGDKDRAKYQAIGESDRMTLLFVKK